MKKLIFCAAFAAATFAAALPAQAITFNFFWSSDPALDDNLISSDDPTITVTGTMDINVAPGAMFGLADVANVNLRVAGPNLTGFTISEWDGAAGTIADDGLSASFIVSGGNEPFAFSPIGDFFGCTGIDCEEVTLPELGIFDQGTRRSFTFDYASSNAALASMRMTAAIAPIPLPAGLPLLIAALGALGLLRCVRRQP